jgi:CDP-diacylglycerol--glycerol-3-phosphate 3-phosphatidyltransferase
MKDFISKNANLKQLPNALTLMRVFLIPVVVLAFFVLKDPWGYRVSAFLFVFAGITDWLDGFLARKLNVSSPFGAFLDPVADKLMVATVVVCLVVRYPHVWFAIPAAMVVGREIAISALREWMAELGQRASVAVAWIGKIKTTMQMIALTLLLYHHPFKGVPVQTLGIILFYVATILTLWSMGCYFMAAFRLLWPETQQLASERDQSVNQDQ